MKVSLTLIKPGRDEEVLTFDQPTEITIGRSPNCTLSLDHDAMVSRMHAVLLIDPPSVRIKDLNSTNGMLINGVAYGGMNNEKLFQPWELRDGDEVMIGTTVLRVDMTGVDKAADEKHNAAAESTVIGLDKAQLFRRQRLMNTHDTMHRMATDLPDVPGYFLRKFLGMGRNGAVYQGVTTAGDKVAVKVVYPEAAFTRQMLAAFSREIDNAKTADHPHIVRLLDFGAIGEKCIYLVLEYVSGEDLASYLQRCPDQRIPLRTAYGLMMQIASALAYSHDHGFVHRDLKPQSVLLTDESGRLTAKLTDIGLTKCFDTAGIARPGGAYTIADSLAYIAPEQLLDKSDLKPAADVFSVGAVFYQMLAGNPPYDFGSGDSDRIGMVSRHEIVPLEKRMPGLPEQLTAIIDHAMSLVPEARFGSGGELLQALENVQV